MYKIIDKTAKCTIGKTDLKLDLDEIFIYTYKDKDIKALDTNKYKVIKIDNVKKVYHVILWETGTFGGRVWAKNKNIGGLKLMNKYEKAYRILGKALKQRKINYDRAIKLNAICKQGQKAGQL